MKTTIHYIVKDNNTFGYLAHRKGEMLVMAVDTAKGGNAYLINETIPTGRNIRDAREEDFDRFRIKRPHYKMQYCIHNENTFGYPLSSTDAPFFEMVVMRVNVEHGGDPTLIDRTVLVNRENARPAFEEDYDKFRIHRHR